MIIIHCMFLVMKKDKSIVNVLETLIDYKALFIPSLYMSFGTLSVGSLNHNTTSDWFNNTVYTLKGIKPLIYQVFF